MALRTRVDGQELSSVPSDDRGLLYGDGVFETIAVYRGQPLLLEAHLARLSAGCKTLGFNSVPAIEDLTRETLAVSEGIERGAAKLIMTRGSGDRGYSFEPGSQPRLIASLAPWPDYRPQRQQGMRVGMCTLRLSSQPRLAGIKHLNRLEQVLARGEWQAGWQEALLQDQRGLIVSGTQSNIFVVIDGVLVTPQIIDCGIAGIMRNAVLTGAGELGITSQQDPLPVDSLDGVEQAFMTNSLLGVAPITDLCGRHLEIGSATRRLQDHVNEKQLVVPD